MTFYYTEFIEYLKINCQTSAKTSRLSPKNRVYFESDPLFISIQRGPTPNFDPEFAHGDESDRNAIWSGFFWRSKIPNSKLYIRLKPNLLVLAKYDSPLHRKYSQALAGMILSGWGSTNEENRERYISNAEMRNTLLLSGDIFRLHVLWKIETWSMDKEKSGSNKWSKLLPLFLRDVWPRQKSAKTPEISARLVKLAFSNTDRFLEISEIILPLLTTINRDDLMLHNLHEGSDTIVDLHPEQTLALLHAVLPDNVSVWPYNIEAILNKIGEANESLNQDERLLELKRKWRSR